MIGTSRLRTGSGIAAASVLLLSAGTTAAPGASAQVRAAATTVESSGPIFNNPLGTQTEQRAIRSKLLQYINTSPTGSSIKVALYHFWDQELAQALSDAHTQRGVVVRLVLDESTVSARPSDQSHTILSTALGTDTSQPSFVTLCPAGKSCLGRPEFGKSINHNKFWLFSQVDGASNVTVQTSSNLSPSAYTEFWNDAYVVAENSGIFNAYSGYFSALVGRDWENWRYTSSSWNQYKAYFYPYYPGTGNSTDTVWNILDNVTCRYTQDGVSKQTKVRVAMFKFTRQGVADKLVALKTAGCSVELVYSETDSADSSANGTTPGTWETLHSASGFAPVCYHHDHDGNSATASRIIHSKYLLIDGKYDDAINKVVWTGSHNYTGPALRENDEALLKIDDSTVHDSYAANFSTVKAAASPGTADNVARCKGVITQPEG